MGYEKNTLLIPSKSDIFLRCPDRDPVRALHTYRGMEWLMSLGVTDLRLVL